jgi:hypothetical protein
MILKSVAGLSPNLATAEISTDPLKMVPEKVPIHLCSDWFHISILFSIPHFYPLPIPWNKETQMQKKNKIKKYWHPENELDKGPRNFFSERLET